MQSKPLISEENQNQANVILSSLLNVLPSGRYHVSELLPRMIINQFEVCEVWYQSCSDLALRKLSYDSVPGWFELQ
jgi:hypothetical protein